MLRGGERKRMTGSLRYHTHLFQQSYHRCPMSFNAMLVSTSVSFGAVRRRIVSATFWHRNALLTT